MKIIKKAKRKPRVTKDPKKESVFKLLARSLSESGYVVRRELLRQGHGWKASSGSCLASGEKILFVDRRLTQDEQISCLLAYMNDKGVQPSEEVLQELPEPVRHTFQAAA
jgi:hypothetical protein